MKYDVEIKEIEDSDSDAQEEQNKGEEVKEEEEPKPTEYSCQVCTFVNPITAAACDMCTTPRPPMEQLQAEFLASLKSTTQTENKGGEQEGKEEEKKEEYFLRLELLANDL